MFPNSLTLSVPIIHRTLLVLSETFLVRTNHIQAPVYWLINTSTSIYRHRFCLPHRKCSACLALFMLMLWEMGDKLPCGRSFVSLSFKTACRILVMLPSRFFCKYFLASIWRCVLVEWMQLEPGRNPVIIYLSNFPYDLSTWPSVCN